MNVQNWMKTVVDTATPFRAPAFDYLEGPPFESMTFAGIHQAHVMDRAFIDTYNINSAGLISYGGLLDYGATLPTFAYHLRVNIRGNFVVAGRRPNPTPAEETPEYIPGRWLYGGELMHHHFGHFMAESSHRVYSLTDHFATKRELGLPQPEGIIFSGRSRINNFSKALLCDYYDIPEKKILVVDNRAAMVEHLEIRPQGSILGGGSLSSAYLEHLNHYQAINSQRVAKDFPKKLFIGRAHLTGGGGGIEDEHVLQRILETEGFTAVHPEEFPLLEQLEMLRQAEVIVGVGGSFVHLYDHLGGTDASMFLISRGDRDAFYHDRTVQQKVAQLCYYKPETERGDSVTEFEKQSRVKSHTRYNMEALTEAALAFVGQR